jgi:hypothetical protein
MNKDLTTLVIYEAKINEAVHEANALVRKAASIYLHVGNMLLEAREMFPGDKEFGQWAAEACPTIDKRWRSSLIKAARKFGKMVDSSGQPATDSALLQMPISTLVELAPASDDMIESVEKVVEESGPITRNEARALRVSENKGEITPEEVTGEEFVEKILGSMPRGRHQPKKSDQPEVPGPDIRLASLLTMPLAKRIEHTEDPFVIFGLNPLTDYELVALDTLECMYECFKMACTTKVEQQVINEAFMAIRDATDMTIESNDLGLICYRETTGFYDD